MNKSRAKVHGYSIGRLKYHCYNRGNYFVDVNGTTAKPNPNISVEECVSNETYFLNMCPSLEAQQLKAKLLRVETKTKPCDLCKLGINRLLEIKYDQLEH